MILPFHKMKMVGALHAGKSRLKILQVFKLLEHSISNMMPNESESVNFRLLHLIVSNYVGGCTQLKCCKGTTFF